MVEKKTVVGIDIGKDTVEVSQFGTSSATRSLPRTVDALTTLAEELHAADVALVAMEASGGYERLVLETLHVAGLEVALVQPQRVRAYAKAIGRRVGPTPSMQRSSLPSRRRSSSRLGSPTARNSKRRAS